MVVLGVLQRPGPSGPPQGRATGGVTENPAAIAVAPLADSLDRTGTSPMGSPWPRSCSAQGRLSMV